MLSKYARKTQTIEVGGDQFTVQEVSDRVFETLMQNENDNPLWITSVVIEPDMTDAPFDQLSGAFVQALANACKDFVVKQYNELVGNES